MSEAFLELERATVWRGSELDVPALRDVSLRLETRESVAILGPNGSGKSTLLQVMCGGLRPEWKAEMQCRLFEQERWVIEDLRERVGMVMPEEVARFDGSVAAFEVVISVFRGSYGVAPWMTFSREEQERASRAVDRMGVEALVERSFGELSSGERRRFLIARALAPEPEVLVLDEPMTALDFAAGAELGGTLRGVAQRGHTLVLVTHDPREIPPEIERVVLLKDGQIFGNGRKSEVMTAKQLSALYELPMRVAWTDGWCGVQAEVR